MGICRDVLAEPLRPFSAGQREQVRRHMVAAGLLEA
jgi:hypothetical protein